MAKYRIVNGNGEVEATAEHEDTTQAHNWFKTKGVGDDLGWALEVETDSQWIMVDMAEGGSNPHGADDK